MDAVGAVDVDTAGRPEHHGVAGGWAAIAVGGRIGLVIGLDLDDGAADLLPDWADQERRPDQVRRHVVDAATEEAGEPTAR